MQVGKLALIIAAFAFAVPETICAFAFVGHPVYARARLSPSSSPVLSSKEKLSDIDEMCIENVAEFCLEAECDIEEYEALVNQ
jgi:hypothetical protein